MSNGREPRRYAVFLSYRHADNKEAGRQWATWLHQMLESFEVPPDLVGTKNSKGQIIPENLYPVFRDEEELPADADLTRNIRQALENSELLVVLCSPRAVESTFVSDEIRYFKELGKADRILALMIDGEPNASDDPGKAKLGISPDAECLPEPLRYGVAGEDGKIDWNRRTEPIAADVRPEGRPEQGWTTGAAYREALQKQGQIGDKDPARKVRDYEQRLELAKLKVVAGSLAVPLGILTRRDKAMQLRRARQRARALRLWLVAVGVLAVLAVAGGAYALFQRKEALTQRDLANKQKVAAEEALYFASVRAAQQSLDKGDVINGTRYLAQAPKQFRNWEWSYLAARASAPVIELRQEDIYVLKFGGLAQTGLFEAAKKAVDQRYEKDWTSVTSPTGLHKMLNEGSMRSGNSFALYRNKPFEQQIEAFQTVTYGTAFKPVFTADGSCIVIYASSLATPFVSLLGQRLGDESAQHIYVIPVRDRLNFSKLIAGRNSEPSYEAVMFLPSEQGIVVSANPSGEDQTKGRSWLIKPPTVASGGFADVSEVEDGTWDNANDGSVSIVAVLPQEARAFFNGLFAPIPKKVEDFNKSINKPFRRLVDLREIRGEPLALVVCSNASCEMWNLRTRQLLHKCNLEWPVDIAGEIRRKIFGFWNQDDAPYMDWGGSISEDGLHYVMCPYGSGKPESDNWPRAGWAAFVSVAENRVVPFKGERTGASLSARGNDSLWRISPDSLSAAEILHDSPDATHHATIVDAVTGNVVHTAFRVGWTDLGWTRDRRWIAIQSDSTEELILTTKFDGGDVRKFTYDSQLPLRLTEFDGHPDRFMAGGRLFRSEDAKEIISLPEKTWFAPSGRWHASQAEPAVIEVLDDTMFSASTDESRKTSRHPDSASLFSFLIGYFSDEQGLRSDMVTYLQDSEEVAKFRVRSKMPFAQALDVVLDPTSKLQVERTGTKGGENEAKEDSEDEPEAEGGRLDVAGALDACRVAKGVFPTSRDLGLYQVVIRVLNGDRSAQQEAAQRLLGRDDLEGGFYLWVGFRSGEWGHLDDAKKLFEKALHAGVSPLLVKRHKGWVMIQNARWAEAREEFFGIANDARVAMDERGLASARAGLAISEFMQGQEERALIALRWLVEIDSSAAADEYWKTNETKGDALHWENAIPQKFREWIVSLPKSQRESSSVSMEQLKGALSRTSTSEKIDQLFRDVMSHSPSSRFLIESGEQIVDTEYAEDAENQRAAEIALKVADAAAEMRSNAAPITKLRARAFEELEQYGNALKAYEVLAGLPDATAKDLTTAGEFAAGRGESDKAKSIFAQAQARFPKEPSVYYMDGWALIDLNDRAGALHAFETSRLLASRDGDNDPLLLCGLALAQWLNDQKSSAISTYRQLVEVDIAGKWADPRTITAKGWAETETLPLEAIRVATIAKYPELDREARSER